jgi:hypothetical protein
MKSAFFAMHVENTFHAKEILPLRLHKVIDPTVEAIRIDCAGKDERTRGDCVVVLMVVTGFVEQARLNFEEVVKRKGTDSK